MRQFIISLGLTAKAGGTLILLIQHPGWGYGLDLLGELVLILLWFFWTEGGSPLHGT